MNMLKELQSHARILSQRLSENIFHLLKSADRKTLLQNIWQNRPAYKEMMYEVECGNVGAVIVKDQSRLGRDYLQTGMLMEIIFPQYDVRFIAINDGVDSDKGINDFSGIKNYFNDLYARDTSKKFERFNGQRVNAESV